MSAISIMKIVAAKPTHPPDRHDRWTFLTNHGAVLFHLAQNPDHTMREMALALGLTERTTASVVADLRAGGYLAVQRRGRHNHYSVRPGPMRRPSLARLSAKDLVDSLAAQMDRRKASRHAGTSVTH